MVVAREDLKDAWLKNTHCYLEVANLWEKKSIFPMVTISFLSPKPGAEFEVENQQLHGFIAIQ